MLDDRPRLEALSAKIADIAERAGPLTSEHTEMIADAFPVAFGDADRYGKRSQFAIAEIAGYSTLQSSSRCMLSPLNGEEVLPKAYSSKRYVY